AHGNWVFRLPRVYGLHGTVKAAQKLGHAVVESLVLEPRKRLQKHLDDVRMGQRYRQNPEKLEEMAIPCIGPIVPLAVFLTMRPVGLDRPLHQMRGELDEPPGQIAHRQGMRRLTSVPKACSSV